jgi:hypothetical protein
MLTLWLTRRVSAVTLTHPLNVLSSCIRLLERRREAALAVEVGRGGVWTYVDLRALWCSAKWAFVKKSARLVDPGFQVTVK